MLQGEAVTTRTYGTITHMSAGESGDGEGRGVAFWGPGTQGFGSSAHVLHGEAVTTRTYGTLTHMSAGEDGAKEGEEGPRGSGNLAVGVWLSRVLQGEAVATRVCGTITHRGVGENAGERCIWVEALSAADSAACCRGGDDHQRTAPSRR